MKREPCMTLKDMAKEKGVSSPALTKRSKKEPYPEPVKFESDFQVTGKFKKANQYPRKDLLAWFERTNP